MPTIKKRIIYLNRVGHRHTKGVQYTDLSAPLEYPYGDGYPFPDSATPKGDWPEKGIYGAVFAFWSVTGSATGSWISTNPDISVPVGETDVALTEWYVPGGGGPGDARALYIDAFDVSVGWWLDDDFVTVTSDPSLDHIANLDGFVPLDDAQDVKAFQAIKGEPFHDWTVITQNAAVDGEVLHGPAGGTVIAFAMYKTPVPLSIPALGDEFIPGIGTWVDFGVMVGGGGRTGLGRVGPRGPSLPVGMVAAFTLAQTAERVDAELRDAVRDLAAKQLRIATEVIAERLGGR